MAKTLGEDRFVIRPSLLDRWLLVVVGIVLLIVSAMGWAVFPSLLAHSLCIIVAIAALVALPVGFLGSEPGRRVPLVSRLGRSNE